MYRVQRVIAEQGQLRACAYVGADDELVLAKNAFGRVLINVLQSLQRTQIHIVDVDGEQRSGGWYRRIYVSCQQLVESTRIQVGKQQIGNFCQLALGGYGGQHYVG